MKLTERLSEFEYNVIDILATGRAFDHMQKEAAIDAGLFDMATAGPAMTMQLRGLCVDESKSAEVLEETMNEARKLHKQMDAINKFNWQKGLKPSSAQMCELLYRKMHVRPRFGKEGGLSADKNALNSILEDERSPEHAIRVVELALALSGLEEDRKVLMKPRGADGRMHPGLVVRGAVTGRWTCKKDHFGDGANCHAMSRRLRKIFKADDGYELFSIDQMQAESYTMAFLSGSKWYKKAHESGNVHALVGTRLWPAIVKDKATAKAAKLPWDHNQSYYDLAKRVQHGLNYKLTYKGLARNTHMSEAEALRAYSTYFGFVPEIKLYHSWVANEIKTKHFLVTPMGDKRHFFGRSWDESTIKEAVAHTPQSTVSKITKIILYRLWKEFDPKQLQILLEVHDSVLGQVPEGTLDKMMPEIMRLGRVEVPFGKETMVIPLEAERGQNWGELTAWHPPSK